MIDITDVDMVKFVQKVYKLSQPAGMGMLHYQPGDLTDEEAAGIIQSDGTVNMDYIKGRACKMHIRKADGRLIINDNWHDHTNEQLTELLEHVGLEMTLGTSHDEHGISCHCDDCKAKRGQDKHDPKKDFKKAMKANKDGTAFKIEQWEV